MIHKLKFVDPTTYIAKALEANDVGEQLISIFGKGLMYMIESRFDDDPNDIAPYDTDFKNPFCEQIFIAKTFFSFENDFQKHQEKWAFCFFSSEEEYLCAKNVIDAAQIKLLII